MLKKVTLWGLADPGRDISPLQLHSVKQYVGILTFKNINAENHMMSIVEIKHL